MEPEDARVQPSRFVTGPEALAEGSDRYVVVAAGNVVEVGHLAWGVAPSHGPCQEPLI